MRTRVETLLGRSMAGSWMSTFHALCARLLRREATAIGLPRDFVIYDSSDQVALVKQILQGAADRRQRSLAPRGAVKRSATPRTAWQRPHPCSPAAWNYRDEQW